MVALGNGTSDVVEPVFDLERGRISLGAEAHVLVPAAALLAACRAAGERGARDLGRAVGASIGRRLKDGPRETTATVEAGIDALGGELGWLGLGSLAAEHWGELLVLRFDEAPIEADDDVDPLLSGVVEGALEAWTGRTAHAVVIDRGPRRIRVLVGGARAVGLAQALAQAGVDHLEIVRRLHAAHRAEAPPPDAP